MPALPASMPNRDLDLTAELELTCTLFAGISPTPRDTLRTTWPDFVVNELPRLLAEERKDKRKLPGFVLAEVEGRRKDENTGAHTALAIDVDALPDNDLGRLQKRARRDVGTCCIYETPSSTDEAPRVRVIAALAEPLPPKYVVGARRALAEALGLDPETCGTSKAEAVSQVMFIGRLKGTRERGLWEYRGEIWTPPRVRTDERKRTTRPARKSGSENAKDSHASAPRDTAPGAFPFDSPPDLRSVGACVPPAGVDGDRHALVRALGGWLARRGYAPEAIAEAVRLQIPSSDPDERARQALDAAERVLNGDESPGWEALSQWADQWGRGERTLKELERACKDPREPDGWNPGADGTGEVWSEWWASFLPRWRERRGYHGQRSARKAERIAEARAENEAALEEHAPGLDGLDTDDEGRPYGTVDNVIRCVRHFLGHALALDTTTGRSVMLETVRLSRGPGDTLEAGPWQDMYTTRLQAALNRLRMRHAYGNDVRAGVQTVAAERPLDVLGDWLRGLAEAWDGKARVDGALARYWRAQPGALATAVSRVMLLGIAARGLKPGCQLDTVPVLIGQQGCGKGSSLKALVWGKRAHWDKPAALGYGAERRYCASKLEIGKKDAVASLRGHLVWELAELASVKRADIDEVKAWLTQTSDTFRPPFAHEDVCFERTVAFIGNLNPEKTGHVIVNRDTTGGRRWLPVFVAPGYVTDDPSTHAKGRIDIAGIERDGAQLLGEAARRVLDGEQWHPTDAEVEVIAPAVAAVSEDPVRDDPWFGPVRAWLKRRAKDGKASKGFTIADVFHGALDMVDVAKHNRAEGLRLAGLLRELGYISKMSNGARRWVRAGAEAEES